MGTSLAVTHATIFMIWLETPIVDEFRRHIALHKRYIDDISTNLVRFLHLTMLLKAKNRPPSRQHQSPAARAKSARSRIKCFPATRLLHSSECTPDEKYSTTMKTLRSEWGRSTSALDSRVFRCLL
jgi:hypothetical protein